MARNVLDPAGGSACRDGELRRLLARAGEGDQQALAELYDATRGWVHALALKLVGDHQQAEEVTLDTYLQVWCQARRFDPGRGAVLPWMLVIARSRALDRLRRRRTRACAEADAAQGGCDAAQLDAALDDPERRERAGLVRRALARLPDEQRRAIELAYFDGASHGDIARRLGQPLGTVKTRIRLGLSKLRDGLRALEEER